MDVGIVGLGVMGKNLIKNFINNNIKVSIHNRTHSKAVALENEINSHMLKSFENLDEFCSSLKKPAKIILLVPSGPPVDDYLEKLSEFLENTDIVLDFGNSHYKDTKRRCLSSKNKFMGVGISGGEEGALKGASLMVGGDENAYSEVEDILKVVAAKYEKTFCCARIGPNGAGHFVKMVHNGIEYADMALLAEAYEIFSYIHSIKTKACHNESTHSLNTLDNCEKNNKKVKIANKSCNNMENSDEKASKIDFLNSCFTELSKYNEINGYLLEIMQKILSVKDKNDYLIEKIDDAARNKGTGLWTVISALKQGIPLSLTTTAVFSRFLSSDQDKRHKFCSFLSDNNEDGNICNKCNITNQNISFFSLKEIMVKKIANALILSKAVNYSQNLQLISQQSKTESWNVDLQTLCNIWKNGCIIRGNFLETAAKFCVDDLFELSTEFEQIYHKNIKDLRDVVLFCIQNKLPSATFVNALQYLDSLSTKKCNGFVIQAMRDYFGSHSVKFEGEEEYKHIEWDNFQ